MFLSLSIQMNPLLKLLTMIVRRSDTSFIAFAVILNIADVIIGFELTAVTAEETVGVVTLVVSVLDGGTTTPITVAIETLNGTATSKLLQFCPCFNQCLISTSKTIPGALDFTSIEQLLFFNDTVMSHDIEVLVINDGIVELNEHFLAVLSLLDPLLSPSKILISPAVANITIVDGKNTEF